MQGGILLITPEVGMEGARVENKACRFEGSSPFGKVSVWDSTSVEGREVRMLEVDGALQSATYLDDPYDLAFDYLALFDLMFFAPHPPRHALMLGGGAFAYPKRVLRDHPTLTLDVVEHDQTIVDVACEYFFLDQVARELDLKESGRLRVHVCEALGWLERCAQAGEHFDAILNDAYIGPAVDAALSSSYAAKLCHTLLEPAGVYLANVVSAMEGAEARPLMWAASSLAEVFAHGWVVGLSDCVPNEEDNLMLVACDEEIELPDAIALF